jgi:signal transduction histidine kinase
MITPAAQTDKNRLAELIHANRDQLLKRWAERVQARLAPRKLSKPELMDRLPDFIDDLVHALRGEGSPPVALVTEAAKEHGKQRFRSGFDIEAVVLEYGVVRECVFELISEPDYTPTVQEFRMLSKCLIDAIAAAISEYAGQREEEVRNRSEFEKQLLGIVSHDLRDPLNTIGLSAATLLRRSGIDELYVRGLTRILSSAKRATRLIADLLDFTQARVGGGIPIRTKEFNFHDLARQIVDEMSLSHPERQIAFTQAGSGEGIWDPDRITQVLVNLLTNALQHSPAGTIVRVATRAANGEVWLVINNQGRLLSDEEIPSLFEPFHRGNETPAEPGSLGLGLFIAKQIVSAHRGKIEVTSSEEAGTTVTVHFPRDAQSQNPLLP